MDPIKLLEIARQAREEFTSPSYAKTGWRSYRLACISLAESASVLAAMIITQERNGVDES